MSIIASGSSLDLESSSADVIRAWHQALQALLCTEEKDAEEEQGEGEREVEACFGDMFVDTHGVDSEVSTSPISSTYPSVSSMHDHGEHVDSGMDSTADEHDLSLTRSSLGGNSDQNELHWHESELFNDNFDSPQKSKQPSKSEPAPTLPESKISEVPATVFAPPAVQCISSPAGIAKGSAAAALAALNSPGAVIRGKRPLLRPSTAQAITTTRPVANTTATAVVLAAAPQPQPSISTSELVSAALHSRVAKKASKPEPQEHEEEDEEDDFASDFAFKSSKDMISAFDNPPPILDARRSSVSCR
jgi:hypothetical protein